MELPPNQMVFLDKFGRHMVNAFRDEGIARFGLDAYRYSLKITTRLHNGMHSCMNCMFFLRKRAGAPLVVEVTNTIEHRRALKSLFSREEV